MKHTSEEVYNRLNDQIHQELAAWYGYLGMSIWCSKNYFAGFAKWLNSQSQEEYMHAVKIQQFLIDRGVQITLQPISEPRQEYSSITEIFEAALAQEQSNSKSLNSIFQLAFESQAYASVTELQWFITEQVEEERTAQTNLAHIKMVASDPAAVLELDKSFGARESIFPIPPA
ncbi:MAG: ferritin [Planctomycetaceae bacterium]|nr:ferritin [Planctomycetaceae bacterium]